MVTVAPDCCAVPQVGHGGTLQNKYRPDALIESARRSEVADRVQWQRKPRVVSFKTRENEECPRAR